MRAALAIAIAVGLQAPARPLAAQEALDLTGVYHLRTLEADAGDLDDLEPLVKLVGEATVVQLGEYAHGLGDSFEARIRITKFLHQRMGFDVVLFETPLFLSREMNDALAGDGSLAEAVDLAVFPIWAHSEQMMELFRYVRVSKRGARPIDLYGVDAQMLPGTDIAVAGQLRAILALDTDPAVAGMADRTTRLLADLQPGSDTTYDGEWFLQARTLLSDLHFAFAAPGPELRSRLSPAERAWWGRIVTTLSHMAEDRALRALAPPFQGDFNAYARHPAVQAGQNRRDQAMAGNIAWFLREYLPGRKAVIWLANSHAQETRGALWDVEGWPLVREHTTGSYLTGMLGDGQVFTLLHSVNAGRYGGNFSFRDGEPVWSEHDVAAADPGTLEHALHEAGVDIAVVDLASPAGREFRLRELPDSDPELPLSAFGDALLFLDQDGPSRERTEPAPQGLSAISAEEWEQVRAAGRRLQ